MRRKLGIISTVLFLVSLAAYITTLSGNDAFLFAGVVIAVLGLVFAMLSEKGTYRKIGFMGNGLILLVSIIIPFIVTTFFWNTP
ncbi:hypothetical protein GLW04_01870 [Halobacillus litoralis]|uniref:DUF3953 domain-containing protein n=1 Tax=Halobacillus litoralis TaxID=45668 RepID=A0A845DMH0_9BACI|nr:hypothetical protein [Halobacillus litoralis]MYL18616.1 hypothetical protein [Halobacillus litoralis]MYL38747.1 hypothetical protein [Halobacillus litoralis]